MEANLGDIIERKLEDYEEQFEKLKKKVDVVEKNGVLAVQGGADCGASDCGS